LVSSFTLGWEEAGHSQQTNKGESMKNIVAVVALAVCMAVPSFASDVVGHSIKVTGKETYKAAKVSAKDTAKAGKAVVKFLL
jgi:hypothetical protein